MIPAKLKVGDEIRVIAPSSSLAIISKETMNIAKTKLEKMGFKVTFGKHAMEKDDFDSSSIDSRVDDLHTAFRDRKVKAILTVLGGYNCNQLLNYLDYGLIRSNPKILCGFSDITALQNAIYAKTGLVTYSGPHFSSFGMLKGFDYTEELFRKSLMHDSPFKVNPSLEWSEDAWYMNQKKRKFHKNTGYWIINEGSAEGTIVGSNLCTFQLLHGTSYLPELKNSLLFIEECVESEENLAVIFDRDLQSLIHQPNFNKVKGMVIGRFQSKAGIDYKKLKAIIQSKRELADIPIIGNVDFGHTIPQITFPIGGKAELIVEKGQVQLYINSH